MLIILSRLTAIRQSVAEVKFNFGSCKSQINLILTYSKKTRGKSKVRQENNDIWQVKEVDFHAGSEFR
jgi:hypothetical protein